MMEHWQLGWDCAGMPWKVPIVGRSDALPDFFPKLDVFSPKSGLGGKTGQFQKEKAPKGLGSGGRGGDDET